MTSTLGTQFWHWSLANYERVGVEPLILHLQDEVGLDANILLWACWCGTSFEPLPQTVVREAIEQTKAWTQKVTIPLRNARRDLKKMTTTKAIGDASDLRAAIKKNELTAEKIEQEILAELTTRALNPVTVPPHDYQTRAIKNLCLYAELAGVNQHPNFKNALLESLASHIFTDTS